MGNLSLEFIVGRAGLLIKRYAPEILLTLGGLGFVGTVVAASKATLKLEPIIDEAKDDISALKELKVDEEIDEPEYKKELRDAYIKTALKVGRTYIPTITLGAATISCILGSHGILSNRNAVALAAYTSVSKSYDKYRQKVREEYGEDKDAEYRYGLHKEKVEVEYVDEKTGKTKTKKEDILVVDRNTIREMSQFTRLFDETNPNYERSPEYNLLFLRNAQNFANQKLRAVGHLLVNDIYDMLGYERTSEGGINGWVFDLNDPERDNYVDFGLTETKVNSFIRGFDDTFVLDFNVEGPILQLLNDLRTKR